MEFNVYLPPTHFRTVLPDGSSHPCALDNVLMQRTLDVPRCEVIAIERYNEELFPYPYHKMPVDVAIGGFYYRDYLPNELKEGGSGFTIHVWDVQTGRKQSSCFLSEFNERYLTARKDEMEKRHIATRILFTVPGLPLQCCFTHDLPCTIQKRLGIQRAVVI